jgi:membrane fusion protein (multidrug efflux system)
MIAGAIAFTWWSWSRGFGSANPTESSASSLNPATPVLASAVRSGSLELVSQYPGELESDISDLASKISGRLQQVTVRSGDRVEQGTVIAVVDDTDLQRQYEEVQAQVAVAEANRLRALARLNEAEQDLIRMEEMFTAGLISAQAIEGVRATAATLEAEVKAVDAQRQQSEARSQLLAQQIKETKVMAPYSGVVSRRYLNPGAFVQPGTPIIRLVEAGPLRVRFWVPEEELSGIRPGVRFEVSTQSTEDVVGGGRVSRLSGEVSRQNRTVAVEGVLESAAPALLPGMYAQVRVSKGRVQGKIIPGAAVISRVDLRGVEDEGVFTVEDGTAHWIRVEVLGREGDEVAVVGALADTDRVLVFGHQDLVDGARVAIVEASPEGGSISSGEQQL